MVDYHPLESTVDLGFASVDIYSPVYDLIKNVRDIVTFI